MKQVQVNCFQQLKRLLDDADMISLWRAVTDVNKHCSNVLDKISSFHTLLKSRYLEWTDAGPGVGITNHDVHYRIAQKIRIVNTDYSVRFHLSNGDNAHNEVERCQGYMRDAICDFGGEEGHWSRNTINYSMKTVLKNNRRT